MLSSRPQLIKSKRRYRGWHFCPNRLYQQQLGLANQGKRGYQKKLLLYVMTGGFHFIKFCFKNKGSRQLLRESGWCVVCFLETLKSVLPQQGWDGVLDSCPWSIPAELHNCSSLWGGLPDCVYSCIIQDIKSVYCC